MEGDIFNLGFFFFFSKVILMCPAGNGAGKKLFARNRDCCEVLGGNRSGDANW